MPGESVGVDTSNMSKEGRPARPRAASRAFVTESTPNAWRRAADGGDLGCAPRNFAS